MAVTNGYSNTKRGQLYVLDSRIGERLWTGPGRFGNHASLIATRDAFLVLTDQGTLDVYQQLQGSLQIKESYVVSERSTWAHGAVAKGYVIVKETENVSVWRVAQPLVDRGEARCVCVEPRPATA
jgi:hypothetical protein